MCSRLGDFVQLVDQMLLSHIVCLMRQSLEALLLNSHDASATAGADGFFKTFLVFGPDGTSTFLLNYL